MKRFITGLLLALSLLATSVPTTTQAAEVTQFTGGILSADFSGLDPSDPTACMSNSVSFYALDGTSGPGKGDTIAWISLAIARYNTCTNETLVEAYGFSRLDGASVEVTKHLDTASLQGTVNVTDVFTGETFPVTLDVRWTGVGNTTYIRQRTQIQKPGFTLNSTGSMAVRSAAATGTVMAPWGNATPAPAYSAQMRWISNSTLTLDN